MNVPPSKKCSLYIVTTKPEVFNTGVGFMTRLAYAEEVIVSATEPEGHESMASCVTHDAALYMPMAQLVDVEKELARIARVIYAAWPCDGKYILDGGRLILCQSNAPAETLTALYPGAQVNPLGNWTGGSDVDSGATNRKLGSDMADSVTGGGLHGKDLSKADVSVNIHAWLKAQRTGQPVELCCAIGDNTVDDLPYSEIVEEAREYIRNLGGFEAFAEWGLVR
jgi:S-adenosylmethionine synthetase